jgi:hypothetical protein
MLTYTLDCQQLYAALKDHCTNSFTGKTDTHTDMDQFEDFLIAIELTDLDYAPRHECYMDLERAFLEMTRFCVFDLAAPY